MALRQYQQFKWFLSKKIIDTIPQKWALFCYSVETNTATVPWFSLIKRQGSLRALFIHSLTTNCDSSWYVSHQTHHRRLLFQFSQSPLQIYSRSPIMTSLADVTSRDVKFESNSDLKWGTVPSLSVYLMQLWYQLTWRLWELTFCWAKAQKADFFDAADKKIIWISALSENQRKTF